MAIRGGIQHRKETPERIAGGGHHSAVVPAIQFKGQGRGEETETFLKAALKRATRAGGDGVEIQADQGSKGTRPGAATLAPSGSTAYSPVKQA